MRTPAGDERASGSARPESAARTRLAGRASLAGRVPPSAVLFGPHVTNLGEGRAMSPAHAAYYAERAAGGAGIIVTETASVHGSDHPYEYAPLASACAEGWRCIVEACRPHGTLVLAGIGHRGLQGSSAYHRRELWGPSPVADPATRELPMAMEDDHIRALVDGFAQAARRAVLAGCDGVEVDAGPLSLLRQFLSGVTNLRTDAYGSDPARLLREVLAAVRAAVGPEHVLGLRLTCDEAVDWGGITPDGAARVLAGLETGLDLITPVRGGLYTADAYRPGMHPPPSTPDIRPGFNGALCRRIRTAAGGVPVVLQGSVVDAAAADRYVHDGTADLVEMTRALIADPALVATARSGRAPRPCLRCNQACMVDDPRNPVVDCVVRPRPPAEPAGARRRAGAAGAADAVAGAVPPVLILGAGVAGLAAARQSALTGARVTVLETAARPGGVLRAAAVARPGLARLADWLEDECRRLSVEIVCDAAETGARARRALAAGVPVVQATGGSPRPAGFPCAQWAEAATVLAAGAAGAGPDTCLPDGPVLVHDPIGGPAGAAVAEWLAGRGRSVGVVTPDPVVGSELARAGDLAGANVRLQRMGVVRHVFSEIIRQGGGAAVVGHRHTGERTEVPCAAVVDCAPRLPGPAIGGAIRAGDCAAPRTALEAVREGEAAARAALGTQTGTRRRCGR